MGILHLVFSFLVLSFISFVLSISMPYHQHRYKLWPTTSARDILIQGLKTVSVLGFMYCSCLSLVFFPRKYHLPLFTILANSFLVAKSKHLLIRILTKLFITSGTISLICTDWGIFISDLFPPFHFCLRGELGIPGLYLWTIKAEHIYLIVLRNPLLVDMNW